MNGSGNRILVPVVLTCIVVAATTAVAVKWKRGRPNRRMLGVSSCGGFGLLCGLDHLGSIDPAHFLPVQLRWKAAIAKKFLVLLPCTCRQIALETTHDSGDVQWNKPGCIYKHIY